MKPFTVALAGALVVLPIFFVVQGGLQLAPRYTSETVGAPIVTVTALLLPLVFLLSAPRLGRLSPTAFLMLLGFVLAITAGLFRGVASPRVGSMGVAPLFMRYAQTLLPILAFPVAYCATRQLGAAAKIDAARTFLLAVGWSTLVFALLYVLQRFDDNLYRFSYLSDHIGPFFSPKAKRFFPMFMAVGAVAFLGHALSGLSRRPLLYWAAFGILTAFVLMSWSRTAALALVAGVGVCVALRMHATLLVAGAMLGTAALVAVGFLVPWDAVTGTGSFVRLTDTVTAAFGGGVSNPGDVVRFERLSNAVQHGLFTPFGDGFLARPQFGLPPASMLIAENGYLDIAVRGGFLAFAIFALIVLAPLRAVPETLALPERHPVRRAALPFYGSYATMLVGTGWLHLATDVYFGVFLWGFVGLMWSMLVFAPRRPISAAR